MRYTGAQLFALALTSALALGGCASHSSVVPGSPDRTTPLGATRSAVNVDKAGAITAALPTNGTAVIAFKTEPGAKCSLSGAPKVVFYGDVKGRISFTVAATSAAPPLRTQTIDCAERGGTRSIPFAVSHIPGRAAAAKQTSLEPVPVGSNQIAAANARLGFDVTTASNAQLVAHDLPQRPDAPEAYDAWLRAATRPITEVVRGGVPIPGRTAGNYNSPTWSGYVVDGPPQSWKLVQGQWSVPQINLAIDAVVNDTMTQWVGLDGYSLSGYTSQDVIQDGTGATIATDGNLIYSYYYVWYEYYPSPILIAFYVNPGDAVSCQASAASPTSPTTDGVFYCQDLTSGLVLNTSLVNQGFSFYGTSAEWIVEREQYNGVPSGLADYQTATMYTPYVTKTSNGQSLHVQQLPNENITMVGPGGTLSTAAFLSTRCTRAPCYRNIGYTWYQRN